MVNWVTSRWRSCGHALFPGPTTNTATANNIKQRFLDQRGFRSPEVDSARLPIKRNGPDPNTPLVSRPGVTRKGKAGVSRLLKSRTAASRRSGDCVTREPIVLDAGW